MIENPKAKSYANIAIIKWEKKMPNRWSSSTSSISLLDLREYVYRASSSSPYQQMRLRMHFTSMGNSKSS